MKKTFRDLVVWQKAHKLVLRTYEYTKTFPQEERYGLTSDLRRAVRSVATNLVEGYKRKGYHDALRFFNYSSASLVEVEYHTILAQDLGYLTKAEANELKELQVEVGKMLTTWQKNYRPKYH